MVRDRGAGSGRLDPATREKMAEVAIARLRAAGVLRRGEGVKLVIPAIEKI